MKDDNDRLRLLGAAVLDPEEGLERVLADEQVEAAAPTPRVMEPADPLPAARLFVTDRHTQAGRLLLRHHQGEFFRWNGSYYAHVELAALKRELYEFAEPAVFLRGDTWQRFRPTKDKIEKLLDATRSETHLSRDRVAPQWLDDEPGRPRALDLVACRNGLLNLPTRTLLPHTPCFYSHDALDFDYVPNAAPPTAWFAFLDQIWGADEECKLALQMWFGYVLTSDTSQQKILVIVGPKRSGKGTIARILTAVRGAAGVCAPTLGSLATNFGMWPMIGKPLAIIADARLSGRTDQAGVTERLLSISGEDRQTIDRKHREPWTGRLPTRIMILTNEIPRLADASGALAGRCIILPLTRSFFDREDFKLTDLLLTELPGILNWSVDGWHELQRRGRLLLPASGSEQVARMEELGSPITSFIRDCCTVGPEHSATCQELFRSWCTWCEGVGRDHAGTEATFGRDLHAAVPGLTVSQPRTPEGRLRRYQGIGLR